MNTIKILLFGLITSAFITNHVIPMQPIDTSIPYHGECTICCESMEIRIEGTKPITALTTCGHIFHATCIQGFLKVTETCPLCVEVMLADKPVLRNVDIIINDDILQSFIEDTTWYKPNIINIVIIMNCSITRIPDEFARLPHLILEIINCPQFITIDQSNFAGSLIIKNCPLVNLGNLTEIGGLAINDCHHFRNLKNLIRVESPSMSSHSAMEISFGDLVIDNCRQFTDMGNLTHVKKNCVLKDLPLFTDLGDLASIGGNLVLKNCLIYNNPNKASQIRIGGRKQHLGCPQLQEAIMAAKAKKQEENRTG